MRACKCTCIHTYTCFEATNLWTQCEKLQPPRAITVDRWTDNGYFRTLTKWCIYIIIINNKNNKTTSAAATIASSSLSLSSPPTTVKENVKLEIQAKHTCHGESTCPHPLQRLPGSHTLMKATWLSLSDHLTSFWSKDSEGACIPEYEHSTLCRSKVTGYAKLTKLFSSIVIKAHSSLNSLSCPRPGKNQYYT